MREETRGEETRDSCVDMRMEGRSMHEMSMDEISLAEMGVAKKGLSRRSARELLRKRLQRRAVVCLFAVSLPVVCLLMAGLLKWLRES